MKKINSLLAVFLAVSIFSTGGAYANENIENVTVEKEKFNINIHDVGRTNSITIDSDYDWKSGYAEKTETYGSDLKGNFKVDSEEFSATIRDEDKNTYKLDGSIEQVLEDGVAYFYKGSVNNEDNLKFEALVEKESHDTFKATINILEYESEGEEIVSSGKTFIFDGKDEKKKKYKEKSDQKPLIISLSEQKDSSDSFSLLATKDYYRLLAYETEPGMRFEIQGPTKSRVDAGNNISIRFGTKTSDIEDMLRERGIEYTGNHDIVHFRVRIHDNDDEFIFNTVDPISDSEEKFSVPIWLGSQIGLVDIPVEASSVDISGSGTSELIYDFKWNTSYFPSGYTYDIHLGKDPGNKLGYAVRYFADTSPYIKKGKRATSVNGYFKYRSLKNVYSLLLHEYTEITVRSTYYIEVID